MMNPKEQIALAAIQYEEIKADHEAKLIEEEKLLAEASHGPSQLNFLKLEGEIEAHRAIRENNLMNMEKLISDMEIEFNKYLKDLETKTDASLAARYNEITKLYKKEMDNFIVSNNNKPGENPVRTQYINELAKNNYVVGAVNFVSYPGNYVPAQGFSLNYVHNLEKNGWRLLGKKQYGVSPARPDIAYFVQVYGLPLKEMVDKAWIEADKIIDLDNVIFKDYKFHERTKTLGGYNLDSILKIINATYPSVKAWKANPDKYSYVMGFAEETPWPSRKQLDSSIKYIAQYGSKDYIDKSLEYLKQIAEVNTREDAPFRYEYEIKSSAHGPIPTLPDQLKNVFEETAEDKNLNPVINWYFPRPKDGYLFVPGMDYINPATMIVPGSMYNIGAKSTSYGLYLKELQKLQRPNIANMLLTFMNPLAGGPFCAIDPNSAACKMGKDLTSLAMGAAKIWVASAVGFLTGGVGASIASAFSAVVQDPNLGLGKGDLGRLLVALSEAYAIARVTDAPINKALQEVVERQTIAIAKRELGKQTGLDKSVLGRLAVDLTVGTGFGIYKDQSFVDSITGSADNSWRLAVARENPYGAILMAGVTEVEKNGWSVNSSNPMDWFNNISLTGELDRLRGTIRGKDLARVIGLTYMTSAGKISEGDALLMIGQEASKRNIERFHKDKPIVVDPEMESYYEKQREVGRWKQGISVMQKLSTGVPPSKDDIMILTDNVAGPIYDRVKEIGLPTEIEVNFWDIAINDVGLPNLAQYTPDVSFTMPDWLKSSKSDGHVVITDQNKMTEALNNKFTEGAKLTKEDIVQLILALFPRKVPLVPWSKDPMAPTFNYIDEFGNLKVRDPLKFPYDHPMVKAGYIPKKYTKAQQVYMQAREAELKKAREQMALLEKRLEELQTMSGMT